MLLQECRLHPGEQDRQGSGREITIIKVKSTPENWEKEKDGRKPNTVRALDGNDTIQDMNAVTGEVFERKITDVTTYDGRIIISWKEDEKHVDKN